MLIFGGVLKIYKNERHAKKTCQVSHELTKAPQLISLGDLDLFSHSKKDKAFFLSWHLPCDLEDSGAL